MSEPLMVDEGRYMEGDRTGIFVRAKRKGGSWESVDIYSLDYPSLMRWLKTTQADKCVAILLDHDHNAIRGTDEGPKHD